MPKKFIYWETAVIHTYQMSVILPHLDTYWTSHYAVHFTSHHYKIEAKLFSLPLAEAAVK